MVFGLYGPIQIYGIKKPDGFVFQQLVQKVINNC